MVFLVPASTDRVSIAAALRKLLTSAAGSLNTIGPRDSQVLALSDWTFWWRAAHIFIISLFFLKVGVVVYGYRPKIWFLLNRHDRSDTLLQEIQSTPFDETPGNNIGQIFEIYLSLNILGHSVWISECMFVCLPLQVKQWRLRYSTS